MRRFILALAAILLSNLTTFPVGKARAEIIAELRPGPEEAGPPQQSQLRLSLNVPLTDLASLLNRYVFTIRPQASVFFGAVTIDYIKIDHVTVLASPKPNYPLRIRAPFRVIGHGAIILNEKGLLDEKGVTTIDFGVTIGSDWCPLLLFDKPMVDLSSSTPVPAGLFTSFKEYIAERGLRDELEHQLNCDNLKKFIGEAWRRFIWPITIASNTMYLGVDPESIAISALKVMSDHVSFRIIITAKTYLSNTTIAEKTLSLPSPKQIILPNVNRGPEFEGLVSSIP